MSYYNICSTEATKIINRYYFEYYLTKLEEITKKYLDGKEKIEKVLELNNNLVDWPYFFDRYLRGKSFKF